MPAARTLACPSVQPARHRRSPPGCNRRNFRRRLLRAAALATLLAAIGGVGSAFAQCVGLCPAQTADQEFLLSPFNSLLSSPAGVAVLTANLQTENNIYLNSTQAEKIAAGTALIFQL